jgi:hypothetical protein
LNREILEKLGLGKKLPYKLFRDARNENEKLTEFVENELLRKVIEVAILYRRYQMPEYPPELKMKLPDYAPRAAKLGEYMTRDSFGDWWYCVEAEFEDWREEFVRQIDEPGLTEQDINRMVQQEISDYVPDRSQFPSYAKDSVRRKLWGLAYP